jgi:hypothetical protein
MMSSEPAPRTLDTWLRQLDAVRLPITRAEQLSLQRSLTDDHLSLRDVALRAQASPTFVLALIREASKGRNEPISTTEMALRRLGLGRALALLLSLDNPAEDAMTAALGQLQLISLHAMQQADGLFGNRLARLAGEIQLASLLFLAPLWPLAHAHPQRLRQWAQRVLIDREPAAKVGRELFGIELRSLCLALTEHWRLPEWIDLGYRLLGRDRRRLVQALHIAHDNRDPLHQQQMLDEIPVLRRWLTQPANTILLANGIAIAAHNDWSDVHSLRWQRLSALYLNLPLDDVQALAHQQAVISARLHAQPGLWHPAQMLVWSAPRDKPGTRTAIAADPAAWRAHCARLRQPASFANAVQLLDCVRDALVACGVPRLLLLVANRDHSQLLMQQSHGLTPTPNQARISAPSHELLRRMLQKPSRLKLDADAYRRLGGHLPPALSAYFEGPPLLLQSLAGGGRVRLILVAEWPVPPQDAQAEALLAQTLNAIELALSQLATPAAGNA